MNETKKVVDSKKAMIEMLEAGDKYFTNKETWTAKGVQEFMDRYDLTWEIAAPLKSVYLCLVSDLSGMDKDTAEQLGEITVEKVHRYCVSGIEMLRINWEQHFV